MVIIWKQDSYKSHISAQIFCKTCLKGFDKAQYLFDKGIHCIFALLFWRTQGKKGQNKKCIILLH